MKIPTMLKQLKTKFPDAYISIDQEYEIHADSEEVETGYYLYLAEAVLPKRVSWEQLQTMVNELLED